MPLTINLNRPDKAGANGLAVFCRRTESAVPDDFVQFLLKFRVRIFNNGNKCNRTVLVNHDFQFDQCGVDAPARQATRKIDPQWG